MSNYAGLEAELYDEFWRDELDDVAFYLDFVREKGGRALDLGCGTGRVLIPLRKAGLDVVGLDPAPEMLEICRRNAAAAGVTVELHCAPMEELELDERFNVLLIPAFSFQLVHPMDVAAKALAKFHQHLLPGGALVLSVFVPDVHEGEDGQGEWHLRKEVVRTSDGARIECRQANRFSLVNRMLHVQNRYSVFDAAGQPIDTQLAEMDIQWHDPDDLAAMLHDAGFKDVTILGDDEPGEDGNATLLFIATA